VDRRDEAILRRGEEALEALATDKGFERWMVVGHSLGHDHDLAIDQSSSNRQVGRRYNNVW
jgi:hypothetical protein